MSEPKTKPTNQSVEEFLKNIKPDQKRKDSFVLLEIFKKSTSEKPIMWGPSIIGFGKYHFKSERSKQEGDWPLVGFSPRKQNLTLYIMAENIVGDKLFEKLGKYKTSKACLYINKLSDVELSILTKLIEKSFLYTKMHKIAKK